MKPSEFILSSTTSNEDACVIDYPKVISTNLEDFALVQTLDFITPIVNDAYDYAVIAAANSLSDIFAMGAKVMSAMNIVAFSECLSQDILKQMIAGLNDTINLAGGFCAGGHTLNSSEVFLGLSVTGYVKKDSFLSNNKSLENDVLIATKPLGTSLNAMAIKANLDDDFSECINGMKSLNNKALELLNGIKINACTDITGFGLIGHLSEMLNDKISIEINSDAIKYYKNTLNYANLGLFGAASYTNKNSLKGLVKSFIEDDLLLYSPETSGGLIISINEKDTQKALDILQNANINAYAFARVVKKNDNRICIF
ncbi:selenide, water dikinase SelD [Campylobacter sp. RM12647]|nr:selenide, water dikinase SelD [Campylobacter sp. RM12647]